MKPLSAVAGAEGFILSHARLHAPPLVPEVNLYLASEMMTLWGETESADAQEGRHERRGTESDRRSAAEEMGSAEGGNESCTAA